MDLQVLMPLLGCCSLLLSLEGEEREEGWGRSDGVKLTIKMGFLQLI